MKDLQLFVYLKYKVDIVEKNKDMIYLIYEYQHHICLKSQIPNLKYNLLGLVLDILLVIPHQHGF